MIITAEKLFYLMQTQKVDKTIHSQLLVFIPVKQATPTLHMQKNIHDLKMETIRKNEINHLKIAYLLFQDEKGREVMQTLKAHGACYKIVHYDT